MWILLITTIICLIIIHHFYMRWKLKDFPGPLGFPLIGNSLDFLDFTKVAESALKYKQKYGNIVKVQVNPKFCYLLVTDYDLFKYILSSQDLITKGAEYEYFESWIGKGLLTSTGSKWKSHRRMITPAFHFSILESFVDVFEANGNILVEKMKNRINESSTNIHPYIKLCTLDIICETAMGTKVNAQIDGTMDYVKAVDQIASIIMDRMVNPYKSIDFIYKFTKDYQTEKKILNIIHNYTRDVIEKRKLKKQQNPEEYDVEDSYFNKKKKLAFIDILLREENNLTVEEIREEVDTFLFEGHDTTSSTINFGLYNLAKYPDIQERIVEEQRQILGDDLKSFKSVTYGELQEMRYLEAFIKETLRLYPAVPQFSRIATHDIHFKNKLIPAGTLFWIFPYGIHVDPEYHPNPFDFDPERFLGQENKIPYAYLPFSAGPRNCIGQKFAMLTIKSILSKVIRNYVLLPSIPEKDIVVSTELVLKSITGFNLRWTERI